MLKDIVLNKIKDYNNDNGLKRNNDKNQLQISNKKKHTFFFISKRHREPSYF